jgi:2-dehydropantoate 2-reductase
VEILVIQERAVTGGIGGYFGARLAAAGEALSSCALRIWWLNSANGDLHQQLVSATDDPVQNGPVDIVIFPPSPA